MSKKMFFSLFNTATIIYLILIGSPRLQAASIFSCVFALLLINGMIRISARKYKEWK
jgi:hypothetical protein